MVRPQVLIFHRPAAAGDAPLVRLLAEVRGRLGEEHAQRFAAAGADSRLVGEWPAGATFGERLRELAPPRGGLVVLSSGAVPLLRALDVRRLVEAAAGGGRRVLTNNRYSSDVCALGDAAVLDRLPPLAGDNALPRWLEQAGFEILQLPARQRLALDIDTPLDAALVALHPAARPWLRALVAQTGVAVPRLEQLRALAADPRAELLVFGRSSAATLGWLERNARCRVRFLAEERGLRSSSEGQRPPRATIGRLLEHDGPAALVAIVARLANGAVLDSRVLLADRHGRNEALWPSAADRYASDLHRPNQIEDAWLRTLTAAAAGAGGPILLGGHSLVGPGLPLLLQARAG